MKKYEMTIICRKYGKAFLLAKKNYEKKSGCTRYLNQLHDIKKLIVEVLDSKTKIPVGEKEYNNEKIVWYDDLEKEGQKIWSTHKKQLQNSVNH